MTSEDTTGGVSRSTSFGAIARDYDRYRPGPPVEALAWILPSPCRSALDIGAGTGALTRLLVPTVELVLAVEPDPRMASVMAAEVPSAEVMMARAEQIPLRSACLDAVVGSSMWHWVDEGQAAWEAARVLRPGGVLGVLWSGPDRSQPWLGDLLAMARPEETADGRGHRRRLQLPDGAPFTEPESRVMSWSVTMAPDHLLELAFTYSRFIVLPEAEKMRRRQAMEEYGRRHETRGGSADIEVPMQAICWRAVRTAQGHRSSKTNPAPRSRPW
jgi:SAM-dependent methyltransferase